MMIIADAVEKINLLTTVALGVALPMLGIGLSIYAVQKPGAHKTCGVAMVAFFILMLLGGLVSAMSQKDAISEKLMLVAFAGCAFFHALSGMVGAYGLWLIRRKRGRWQIGRIQDHWSFWLNWLALFGYGVFFWFRAFPLNIRKLVE